MNVLNLKLDDKNHILMVIKPYIHCFQKLLQCCQALDEQTHSILFIMLHGEQGAGQSTLIKAINGEAFIRRRSTNYPRFIKYKEYNDTYFVDVPDPDRNYSKIFWFDEEPPQFCDIGILVLKFDVRPSNIMRKTIISMKKQFSGCRMVLICINQVAQFLDYVKHDDIPRIIESWRNELKTLYNICHNDGKYTVMGTEILGGTLKEIIKYPEDVAEMKAFLKILTCKSGERAVWLTEDINIWIKKGINKERPVLTKKVPKTLRTLEGHDNTVHPLAIGALAETTEKRKQIFGKKRLDIEPKIIKLLDKDARQNARKKILHSEEKMAYEKTIARKDKIIFNLEGRLNTLLQEKERKSAEKQQLLDKAWEVSSKKAIELATRAVPANAQDALKQAIATEQDNKCKRVLEQASKLFSNLDTQKQDQYICTRYTKLDILETNIIKNVKHMQKLHETYMEYADNIETTRDKENIKCRYATCQKMMKTLKNRKELLEALTKLFDDVKIPYLVDEIDFENALQELKLDCLLLLNEILDTYVPNINRMKAIKEELVVLDSKKLTWRDLCLMDLDELQRMSVKIKEYESLPETIETMTSSLELEMSRITTMMNTYVNTLKKKQLEKDLRCIELEIQSIVSIYALDELTEYELEPEAKLLAMLEQVVISMPGIPNKTQPDTAFEATQQHLRILDFCIEFSKDNTNKMELIDMKKEAHASLKSISEKNKKFIQRVELNPQQTQLNFPEKFDAIKYLKTEM